MDFDDIFDDDLDIMEIVEFGFPRQIHIRFNSYEEMCDLAFFRRFRLYKTTTRYLLALIQNRLEYSNDL